MTFLILKTYLSSICHFFKLLFNFFILILSDIILKWGNRTKKSQLLILTTLNHLDPNQEGFSFQKLPKLKYQQPQNVTVTIVNVLIHMAKFQI